MVSDSDKFKSEDVICKNKIEAKNLFENYCFEMKNTLIDEKPQGFFHSRRQQGHHIDKC